MDSLGEWLPSELEQPSNVSANNPGIPIVVDFGSAHTRVGVANQPAPAHSILTRSARFRDRKSGEQHTVVGNDILLEPSARNQVRSPFDGPLLTNWDSTEAVLDYSLDLVGYDIDNSPAPIVISETLLAPHLPHRTMQELLFEGYGTPALAFGADVLAQAAYHHKTNPNVLIVSIGAEATHILPVINGDPKIEHSRRINWGVRHAAEFLHELLVLKYPNFPTPVTRGEVEQMLHKHCFVAEDYRQTVRQIMDVDFLQQFEVRVQAPLPVQSTEASAEAERVHQEQLERRRESGRRLQEQTAIARAERQQRQQEELDQLQQFKTQLAEMEAEYALEQIQQAGFTDMADVNRTVKQLSNALRRARGETIEDPEPVTPLLNVPDAELSPEDLREKRRQRLLRASYDSRQRQRAIKEAQKQKEREAEQRDADWRARDLAGWSAAKRQQLMEILEIIREREKLRKDPRLRFRQTLASNGSGSGGGDSAGGAPSSAGSSASSASSSAAVANGNSGTDVAAEEVDNDEFMEEEARDYDSEASALQMLLLEHDPDFDPAQLEPQVDWRDSTVHKFLWGAHPYEPENLEQNHQLNLNIERVRVVEPLFQPQIAGVDQAGLSESVTEVVRRFPQLAAHIQLSGGGARIGGLAKRLEHDLRRELPSGTDVNVSVGKTPEFDSWRGLASWSNNKKAYVTRKQYEENGSDYIKEHKWGNPYH